MKFILQIRLLVWALLVAPLLAQAQPAIHSPSAYFPADQARYRLGAPAPARPAGLPPASTAGLRPGVAVFGWLPSWVPASYVQQVEFKLLTHVAYDGYQATEAGGLQAPATGDAAPLAALVHQANPACRVLLGVGYQEPADGTLWGPAGGAARLALVQAVARQVGVLGADGVHLDLTFRPRPVVAVAAAEARPASQRDRDNIKKQHVKMRADLNDRHEVLSQTTAGLGHIRADFAQRTRQGKPIAPTELNQYARKQQRQQADSLQFIAERTRFRAEEEALKKGQVLGPTGATGPAGTDGRPAALRELVQALRRALPQATLTLGLPAIDSAKVYTGIGALTPAVDSYVLHAFDYTAGRAGEPGPLAPLQPGAAGSLPAVATSVDYYLKQGLRPAQLLVGLASLGKVWTEYNAPNEMPAEGAPVRYWYLTSRSLAAWRPKSQQPDVASGSLRLALPPPADSLRGSLLKAPYKAWADDSASLAARYDWVLSQGLGGVGIWALGFDAPDAPLWAYVRARLGVPPARPAPAAADTSTSAAAATDTTAAVATPAQADTTKAAAEPWTPLSAVEDAGNWVEKSALARVLLLGLMVLLAGVWVGMMAGAARTARYWVPFARRRTWMLALLLGVAALLALYASCVGSFESGTLWVAWLGALGLLVSLWVAYRQARPAYPLP